jgi:hypothetical protein
MTPSIIHLADQLITGEISPDQLTHQKKDELILIISYLVGINRGLTKPFKGAK